MDMGKFDWDPAKTTLNKHEPCAYFEEIAWVYIMGF